MERKTPLSGYETSYFKVGENWCYLCIPHAAPGYFDGSFGFPLVIQCHGQLGYVRDGASDWLDRPGRARFLGALLSRGVAVSGTHAGGDHWGNRQSVVANLELIGHLERDPRLDEKCLGMWGTGIGAATAWKSFVADPDLPVRAMVLQQSLLSYAKLLESGRFRIELERALGINAADDAGLHQFLEDNDPLMLAEKMRDTLIGGRSPRLMLVHGVEDENFLCADHAEPFLAMMRAYELPIKSHLLRGIGHDTYVLGKVLAEAIARFFVKSFVSGGQSHQVDSLTGGSQIDVR